MSSSSSSSSADVLLPVDWLRLLNKSRTNPIKLEGPTDRLSDRPSEKLGMEGQTYPWTEWRKIEARKRAGRPADRPTERSSNKPPPPTSTTTSDYNVVRRRRRRRRRRRPSFDYISSGGAAPGQIGRQDSCFSKSVIRRLESAVRIMPTPS